MFFLVAMPERPHPFPSRTRKLSSPGPMVLQGRLCGRVGRCRGFFRGPAITSRALLFFGDTYYPCKASTLLRNSTPLQRGRVWRGDAAKAGALILFREHFHPWQASALLRNSTPLQRGRGGGGDAAKAGAFIESPRCRRGLSLCFGVGSASGRRGWRASGPARRCAPAPVWPR